MHWFLGAALLGDLGFSLPGSSPVYRWNVAVDGKKPLDLGRLSFRPGGSVAGWIEVPEGAIDPQTGRARLAPTIPAAGPSVAVVERTAQKELTAPCSPEGLFQLAALEPGLYDLSISQPGYTPFRQPGIAVLRGAESFLRQSAVLREPLRLSIQVVPPLDPYGKPWRVRGYRRAEGESVASEAFSGSTGDLGRLDRPEVQPGAYRSVFRGRAQERWSWRARPGSS